MIKNNTKGAVGSVGLLKLEANDDAVEAQCHGFDSQGVQFLKIFTQGEEIWFNRFKTPV